MIYKNIECIRLSHTGNACDKCCKWNVKLLSRVVQWYRENIPAISAVVPIVPIWRLENSCKCLNFLIIYRRRNFCNCLNHSNHFGMTKADLWTGLRITSIWLKEPCSLSRCCISRSVYQQSCCNQYIYHKMCYFDV